MTTRKVAVITDASGGVGAGLVAGYRRRDWSVVASARTITPAHDPELLTVAGDITDPATAGRLVDTALQRFGRIDTLVNNAGVVISKPFTDYTAADYATTAGAALAGFFWLTQRVIADMAMRYGGHVVTVSAAISPTADAGPSAVLIALTRGGLAAATRSLAVEYASRGIRVNAVSPGAIQVPAQLGDGSGDPGGWFAPLGHPGQVSDVVDGVLFLEASPYITGVVLPIDGGQAASHSEALD